MATRFGQVGRIRIRRFAVVLVVLSLAQLASGTALAQGHPLESAAGKMTLAKGLEVRLFAGEPMVRQPILVKCDDRGRLWTIQYLQYPNPAGLKRVKVDRWSRTVYDRVPEPPPKGPRGADRITILEDTDGDGRADRARDFVDGLNLATGLAFGHGGVYVRKVRDIANRTRILCQDRGEQDRQGGILRTLHPDRTGKGNSAFDDDFVHEVFTSQRRQPGKPPGTYSTFR